MPTCRALETIYLRLTTVRATVTCGTSIVENVTPIIRYQGQENAFEHTYDRVAYTKSMLLHGPTRLKQKKRKEKKKKMKSGQE